jgi:hypothetical protein
LKRQVRALRRFDVLLLVEVTEGLEIITCPAV